MDCLVVVELEFTAVPPRVELGPTMKGLVTNELLFIYSSLTDCFVLIVGFYSFKLKDAQS